MMIQNKLEKEVGVMQCLLRESYNLKDIALSFPLVCVCVCVCSVSLNSADQSTPFLEYPFPEAFSVIF